MPRMLPEEIEDLRNAGFAEGIPTKLDRIIELLEMLCRKK